MYRLYIIRGDRKSVQLTMKSFKQDCWENIAKRIIGFHVHCLSIRNLMVDYFWSFTSGSSYPYLLQTVFVFFQQPSPSLRTRFVGIIYAQSYSRNLLNGYYTSTISISLHQIEDNIQISIWRQNTMEDLNEETYAW